MDLTCFDNLNVAEELANRQADVLVPPGDLIDRALTRRESINSGIPVPWSKLENLYQLRPGELVLLGGYSGHGKSALANQIALHAASMDYRVGIASLELPAEFVVDQMASMAGCIESPHEHYMRRFGYWANERIYFYDRVDVITPMDAIKMIIGMRKFYGVDLVVLDCLFMVGLADDLEQEKKFTQTLAAVAKAFDVCVLLVHHLRKPQGADGESKLPDKFAFIGSSHITNVASSVLLCHKSVKKIQARNDGQEFDDSEPDVRIVVAKQRFHHYEGVTGYWMHNKCRAICNSKARQYKPIDLEDGWQRRKTCKSTESAKVIEIGGSSMRATQDSTPATDTTTVKDPFPSSNPLMP